MAERRRLSRSGARDLTLGLVAMGLAAAVPGLSRAEGAAPREQSPAPGSPPRTVGSNYDTDASLPTHATPIASYALRARLDAESHVVSASGTLTWTNTSRESQNEVWLHLYLNAFKNNRTLYLSSPFQAGRSGRRATSYGHLRVTSFRLREENVDLWPKAATHSPGDPLDETDIRVPLPEPVEPGTTVHFDMKFEAKLPSIVERTGFAGSFHFVGQWFPKIARLERDGTWAHFAFHPQSEFYADYGDYSVELDVPADMVVGASGVETRSSTQGGRRTIDFEAKDVLDFAWTAWDGFEKHTRDIDGTRVILLIPPQNEHNAATTFSALAGALPRMSKLYGRYPYPTLTVVHPPESAPSAGGMEYPTLITTGGEWYTADSGVRGIEGVTVHELGHQWFQSMVGSNEHAWPFLDEGLTSYVEGSTLDALYGSSSAVRWPGLRLSQWAVGRAAAAHFAHDDPIALPAAGFPSFEAIGGLVYARTATLLHTLGNVYGTDKLERALGRYSRYYRFQHPGPRHFIAVMREVLGNEAADNLSLALFERGSVDYLVDRVETIRSEAPEGELDGDTQREPSGSWQSSVLVRRHGSLHFPVDVELAFANGTRLRRRWDGRGDFHRIDYSGPSPVVSAIVDPDLRIALDDDLGNNQKSRYGGIAPRSLERLSYGAALLLGAIGP